MHIPEDLGTAVIIQVHGSVFRILQEFGLTLNRKWCMDLTTIALAPELHTVAIHKMEQRRCSVRISLPPRPSLMDYVWLHR
jgi:hypothetical protein